MSWADDNGITCWDSEDYELYYNFIEWRKQEKEEAVSLIDDIKEEDFIMDKKELVINQEFYDLGFISKKDFVVTDLKDKIKLYEAEVNKIINLLNADLRRYKQQYENKEYSPTDITNLSDYLNTLRWQLCYSRDELIGLSYEVNKDISEQAHK